MVSLFYPTQGDDFLLLMGLSGFFEHYFPELNESLIGTWQSQNDTLTLYPLYVQYFKREDVRESWNGVGIRFITKGYVLKLTDDSIRPASGNLNDIINKCLMPVESLVLILAIEKPVSQYFCYYPYSIDF